MTYFRVFRVNSEIDKTVIAGAGPGIDIPFILRFQIKDNIKTAVKLELQKRSELEFVS